MTERLDSTAAQRLPAGWFSGRCLSAGALCGLLLWGVTVASDGLLISDRWEPMGRAAYRMAYLVRLPLIVLLDPAFRTRGHHRRFPTIYQMLTSFGAPVFWGGLMWGGVAAMGIWSRWRMRSATGRISSSSVSRRRFLASAGGLGALGGGLASYATLVEPQRIRVRQFTVPIRDLPASLEGLRIVQVSDTHYGPFVSLGYLREVIRRANALAADLIVLTGDYVHRTPLAIGPGVQVLQGLQARLGVVGVLGNHDHWEGAASVREGFARASIPLLDNRRQFLSRDSLRPDAAPGTGIGICGVGDLWEDEVRFDQALDGVPEEVPRIVLAHNPDTAEQIPAGLRVDLMLSGHTHGGQLCVPGYGPPLVPSAFGQKYAGGWCAGPRCPVIVSRGVGMAILPVRLGVPPEIGEITLVRGSNSDGRHLR